MKKRYLGLMGGVSLGFLVLAGCAVSPVGPGLLVTSVKGPIAPTSNSGVVDKTGKSCAINVLGMIAVGDASIEKAKEKGGVTEVMTVDHSTLSVLGLFSQFCTMVAGK